MKKILLFLITVTFAFSNVGKITALKGEVFIIRDSKQITAKSGSVLILKDQIQTKNKARALVLFNDNTSITVGNNSTLSVNEFVMDLENPKKSKTNFGFGKGIFRTITGKIGKVNPKGFKIKTKSASIGIRGTTLDTSVKSLPNGTEEVIVAFIKGHGFITSDVNGIEIAVNTGENANMLQNGVHTLNKGALQETQKMNQDAKELKSASTKKEKKKSSNESTDTSDVQSEVNSLTEDAKEDVNEDIITNQANELKNEKVEVIEQEEEIKETINNITKETMCPTAALCTSYSSYNITDFGYLKNDENTVIGSYIEGTETSTDVIDEYILNNQMATYSGNIYGLQSGTNIGSSTTEGTIELNMNFGASTFDGSMTIYNGNWQVSIANGSLDTSGFSSTDLSGIVNSTDTITSGKIKGNYYGSTAQAAAGTFNVSTDTQQVIGVFGAKK